MTSSLLSALSLRKLGRTPNSDCIVVVHNIHIGFCLQSFESSDESTISRDDFNVCMHLRVVRMKQALRLHWYCWQQTHADCPAD